MSSFFTLAHAMRTRRPRTAVFFKAAAAALLLTAGAAAHAQFGAPPRTQVRDASPLHPPAGARVAIVEFEDLECPLCAISNPLIEQAAAKYHIPLVRYDYLIPGHIWSPIAATNARWFDSKSKALGDEYRDQVFANQSSIYNPNVLRQFTEKFAQSHGIALPFAIDPQGKLDAAVKADVALGQRVNIDHTPTIFIVTSNPREPYIEVVDRTKLFQTIDQALEDTKPAPPRTR